MSPLASVAVGWFWIPPLFQGCFPGPHFAHLRVGSSCSLTPRTAVLFPCGCWCGAQTLWKMSGNRRSLKHCRNPTGNQALGIIAPCTVGANVCASQGTYDMEWCTWHTGNAVQWSCCLLTLIECLPQAGHHAQCFTWVYITWAPQPPEAGLSVCQNPEVCLQRSSVSAELPHAVNEAASSHFLQGLLHHAECFIKCHGDRLS